jgi:amino-acid N-acetyltransferase
VEVLGETGLLRSVAVAPARRGLGLGRALVAEAEEEARREGVRMLYLLTETAEDYFAALGYRAVGREGLPGAIVRSGQFTTMCPASAVVMTRDL